MNWHSMPGIVIADAINGKITPILHDDIVAEYEDVLNRPKFHFDKKDIQALFDGIYQEGLYIEPKRYSFAMRDEKDRIFYEVLLSARQRYETYLVTGNKRHFPNDPHILLPAQMVAIMPLSETC